MYVNRITFDLSKRNNMTNAQEISLAVQRFKSYIKMGWEVEESFEIAYDSVFDMIEKESFLNLCQASCK
jgi:hypothetical protein